MIDNVDDLINDFYGKYAPDKKPSVEKIKVIKETYKDDYDGLVTDMYSKYAPDNIPDATKLSTIKETYGLKKKDISIPEPEVSSENVPGSDLSSISKISVQKEIPEGTAGIKTEKEYNALLLKADKTDEDKKLIRSYIDSNIGSKPIANQEIINKAYTLSTKGDYDQSNQMLIKLREKGGHDNPYVNELIVHNLMTKGDHKTAGIIIDDAIKVNPGNTGLLLDKAFIAKEEALSGKKDDKLDIAKIDESLHNINKVLVEAPDKMKSNPEAPNGFKYHEAVIQADRYQQALDLKIKLLRTIPEQKGLLDYTIEEKDKADKQAKYLNELHYREIVGKTLQDKSLADFVADWTLIKPMMESVGGGVDKAVQAGERMIDNIPTVKEFLKYSNDMYKIGRGSTVDPEFNPINQFGKGLLDYNKELLNIGVGVGQAGMAVIPEVAFAWSPVTKGSSFLVSALTTEKGGDVLSEMDSDKNWVNRVMTPFSTIFKPETEEGKSLATIGDLIPMALIFHVAGKGFASKGTPEFNRVNELVELAESGKELHPEQKQFLQDYIKETLIKNRDAVGKYADTFNRIKKLEKVENDPVKTELEKTE
jgi:hypothetical protein